MPISLNTFQGTLKLRKPIEINGKEIRTLTFDVEQIDFDLMSAAESLSRKAQKTDDPTLGETDRTYHLFLGMAAIIAVNPWIDWGDLKRLKGIDLKAVGNIGRNFFMAPGALEEETSEEPQEFIVDISTQA